MKILIVEDEEMIADIISAGLTRTGYQCECVYDGAEAAGLLEEKRYDLILLDIMLPGADGYELMEYIKNYNTPVIFITARTRLEDKVRGFKLGADDYITKPFELAELFHVPDRYYGFQLYPPDFMGRRAGHTSGHGNHNSNTDRGNPGFDHIPGGQKV